MAELTLLFTLSIFSFFLSFFPLSQGYLQKLHINTFWNKTTLNYQDKHINTLCIRSKNFSQYKINFLKVSIHIVSCKQNFKISILYRKHCERKIRHSKQLHIGIEEVIKSHQKSKVFKRIKPQIFVMFQH